MEGCAGPQQGWAVMFVPSSLVHSRGPALAGSACPRPARQVPNRLRWSCAPGSTAAGHGQAGLTSAARGDAAPSRDPPRCARGWRCRARCCQGWWVHGAPPGCSARSPVCCDRVPGVAGAGPQVPAASASPTAALAPSAASTHTAPCPGTAPCPSMAKLPWHAGPLWRSLQKLPACPEPNPSPM